MPNDLQNDPDAVSLTPITSRDFAVVGDLAGRIWRAHYSSIITLEQIDYMIGGRFTPENLSQYIASSERWMELLRVQAVPSGYCSWSLTKDPTEMKLEQLYVLPEMHGRGLGSLMMNRIEADARARGCRSLMLTVNKQNENSIKVYRHRGFEIREEVVFDIGRGYVMDDYVMARPL